MQGGRVGEGSEVGGCWLQEGWFGSSSQRMVVWASILYYKSILF